MKVKMMMMAALAMLVLTSCFTMVGGSNNSIKNGDSSDATIKKEINIEDFDEVVVSQGITVIYQQGTNTGKASVATTPSAEKYLKVESNGKTLRIYYDVNKNGKSINIKGPSIVKVASTILSSVEASSGAEFFSENDMNFEGDVHFGLSSAASIEANKLTCNSLQIETSSGAEVEVKNLSGNLDVRASSGSDVEIDAVDAKSISLAASSGADIDIDNISAEEVNAKASSGADISLSGKTNKLMQNSSSGGSVKTKGLKYN